MATFTLSQEDYEALISLAQAGAQALDPTSPGKITELDRFLKKIEQNNGIVRYSLFIRWQDPTAPLPPGTNFPLTWPPTLQYFLQFISRPIALTDVMTVVNARTPNAVNIMVTPDPAGVVGWTQLSAWFTMP